MTQNQNMNLIYDPHYPLRESSLDRRNYALTLLDAGKEAGINVDERTVALQSFLAESVAEHIRNYGEGESTSVKTETAEQMIASDLYTLDTALLSCPTPSAALHALLTQDIRSLYYLGAGIVRKCFAGAEPLRVLLSNTRLPDRSDYYYRFLDIDALNYISAYDPYNRARECIFIRLPEIGIHNAYYGITELTDVMQKLLVYHKEKRT